MGTAVWLTGVSRVLLFWLVCCLSCTVDLALLWRTRSRFPRGIAVAMLCQFGLLPLLGFVAVKAFHLDEVDGVMLIILTSSPGGSYSNWWCSIMNADLTLSVACTAVSNILSAATLPANILIYLGASYGRRVLATIAWADLFIVIAIVLAGVTTGLAISWRLSRCGPRVLIYRGRLNLLGNACGLLLLVLAAIFSSSSAVWNRSATLFVAIALPAVLSFPLAFLLASVPIVCLTRPQRVAVGVECQFQNVGIAVSIALSMFDEDTAGRATITPLYYGLVQVVLLPIELLILWKAGFTHAPASAKLWRVIMLSWQPSCESLAEGEGALTSAQMVPVVSGQPASCAPLRKASTSRGTSSH